MSWSSAGCVAVLKPSTRNVVRLYPETGTTKGDVIHYYATIAPALLPHRYYRIPWQSWWPQELPTDGEALALVDPSNATSTIDILFAHDAPRCSTDCS